MRSKRYWDVSIQIHCEITAVCSLERIPHEARLALNVLRPDLHKVGISLTLQKKQHDYNSQCRLLTCPPQAGN